MDDETLTLEECIDVARVWNSCDDEDKAHLAAELATLRRKAAAWDGRARWFAVAVERFREFYVGQGYTSPHAQEIAVQDALVRSEEAGDGPGVTAAETKRLAQAIMDHRGRYGAASASYYGCQFCAAVAARGEELEHEPDCIVHEAATILARRGR